MGTTIRRATAVKRPATPRFQENQTLRLFKKMAREVPAYKQFLASHGVSAASIRTSTDLSHVPAMTKDNYLRQYQYRDLFWRGTLCDPHVLTSTSGSTGDPFYFARSRAIDEQSAYFHERFFLRSTLSKKKPTLVIVAFGMGVWIGGLITYQAFQKLGTRGYPISVITPGINKSEIFKTLRLLAPQYDQLIFAGYPPFVKDVIDEAHEQGINLSRYKIGIVFAAEAFTEHFRDYIVEKAGITNPLTDTMNIYGTAELGTMAAETPLSILVRRLALNTPALFKELFGDIQKTPTLTQFIPGFTDIHDIDGELRISGNSAMPLLNYAVGDNGGVRTFRDIEAAMQTHGINLREEMRNAKLPLADGALPFAYVYERRDLSTTLYGLQIYPETIREVLLREAHSPFFTGRFTLITKFDENHDQYLEINIELRQDKESSPLHTTRLKADIVKNLMLKNGEYKELHNFLGSRAEPRLIFWPHEDPQYFRRDIKQKWVVHTE